MKGWAVYALEENPPAGIDPIEWMSLTSEPVQAFTAATALVDGYTYRWVIEEWDKVEKTGCRLEASQLQDADALERLAALAVVAVRMLQLRNLARPVGTTEPLASWCQNSASDEEG